MAQQITPMGWVAIIGGAAALGIIAEKEIGVHITAVTYAAGPNTSQVTATVTIVNHTSSQSAYTLVGYQAEASDLAKSAAPPLGLTFLERPETRFAKLVQAGLITGHWFSQPNIVAVGAGPSNPTLAQQERAIAVTVARGQQAKVNAYSGTPIDAQGVVNFWFLFPGSNVLSGVPAAAWLDPSPGMPAV